MSWPDRLGPGDIRTFNASLIMPDGAKRVWLEQWILDTKGLGCWLTHEQLGARLGMTPRSVETYRLRLEDCGCVARLKEPGVRAHGWRSTMPDHCRMRSQRPAPAEVEKQRDYLDLHVGQLGVEPGKWPPKPAKGEDETRSSGAQDPQSRSSKPAPVRVSAVLSTAFDSQADSKLSPALDLEGNRDRSRSLEARRKAEERPQEELEAEGLTRIRAVKAKSQKPLTKQEREAFEKWLQKLPADQQREHRRRAYGL